MPVAFLFFTAASVGNVQDMKPLNTCKILLCDDALHNFGNLLASYEQGVDLAPIKCIEHPMASTVTVVRSRAVFLLR